MALYPSTSGRSSAARGSRRSSPRPTARVKSSTANITVKVSDYTRKGGVMHTEILLPPHAPREYANRQTLWNAVEDAERNKNAQLAYSFDIALQNEFSTEENIALARPITAGQLRHTRHDCGLCRPPAGQEGRRYPKSALPRPLPNSPA